MYINIFIVEYGCIKVVQLYPIINRAAFKYVVIFNTNMELDDRRVRFVS